MLQNGYRDLDPARGQYLQGDPIGLRGGPNLYLHVKANPLRWKDPSGLLVISPSCGPNTSAIQAAEQEVWKRLNASCCGCTDRNTGCIPCKYLAQLQNALQTSRVTCRAIDKLPLACASGTVSGSDIYLYPASTSPICGGAACLGASLLHELLHNIGMSRAAHPEIDFIERRCFSCGGFPTGAPPFVPPSNDPFY